MILEFITALIIGPLTYFIGIYIHHLWNLSKYPKGPFPLPVIGNLHLLRNRGYEVLKNLGHKYGDVYSISLGMERVIIVNTVEAAKDALVTKRSDFAGRPSNLYTFKLISRNGIDIACSDYGKKLRFMRKVAHQSLRMFGDGMEKIETLVLDECKSLEKRLEASEGNPVELSYNLGCSVLNIICYMVFGKRYEIDDPEFCSIIEFTNLLVSGLSNGDPVTFLPWLRFFPLPNLKRISKAIEIRDAILRKQINSHKENFDAENLRDFTDSLLLLAQNEDQWKDNGFEEVSINQLEMIVSDLFVAGHETTTTTLRWACCYLLHWPKFQEEIFQEIVSVVGHSNEIELKHRNQLHLVQATIYETLRLSSLVPLSIPHKAITDSTISGLHVPSDSQVLFNLWAIHHDDRHWEAPEIFNPYRWLDDGGKFDLSKNVSFLPFSAGRRVCLGEVLAKTELFLFITRIIYKYEILPDPKQGLPSLDGQISITLSPCPFNIILKSRSQ